MRELRVWLKSGLDRRGFRWLRTSLRVWSVVLAGGRAELDADLRVALDRFGLRWVLGHLLERSPDLRSRGVTGVVHRHGAWFHRYGDVYLHAERPAGPAPTPRDLDVQTQDTWERDYAPSPGDVVVDIGAGTGTEVLRWSKSVSTDGRVVAVEAHPRTFRVLRTLCALNRLSNVELFNVAVSDSSGSVEIETLDEHVAASTVTGRGAVTVQSVSVDGLFDLARLGQVDYLKMNIEGSELPAVRGMAVAAGSIRNLCVSCHDFRAEWGHGEMFRTRDEVVRALREMGFEVGPPPDDERPWIRDQVFARRPGQST